MGGIPLQPDATGLFRRVWSPTISASRPTSCVFWLTPWRRTDEHLPLSHIAEVIHVRGFFWDAISVESSGGLNPLPSAALPQRQARYFVEHVRERIEPDRRHAAAPPPRR